MAAPSKTQKNRAKDRDQHECQVRRLFDGVIDTTVSLNISCSALLTVHHRFPQEFGGSNSLTNMVTLCTKHHTAIHYTGQTNQEWMQIREMASESLLTMTYEPTTAWNVTLAMEEDLGDHQH